MKLLALIPFGICLGYNLLWAVVYTDAYKDAILFNDLKGGIMTWGYNIALLTLTLLILLV